MSSESFGARLKAYRKAGNMNQSELGKMLNVSQVTIAHYEKGKRFPKHRTLLRLSEIFGLSPGELLDSSAAGQLSHSDIHTSDFSTAVLLNKLLTGRLEEALGYTDAWRASRSLDLLSLFENVFIPLLSDIGERWSNGELLVSEEHLVSAKIRELVLLHSNKDLRRSRISRDEEKSWMGFCAPGEEHELSLLMFSQLLRLNGWKVYYLGPRLPFSDLDSAIEKYRPAVLTASVTMAENIPALEEYVGKISRKQNPPVILLGGAAAGSFSMNKLPDGGLVVRSLSEGLEQAEILFYRI